MPARCRWRSLPVVYNGKVVFYLLDFAQVLCLGGAKSPDLATLELFCRHALGAVGSGEELSASFGKTHGLSQRELERGGQGANDAGLYRSSPIGCARRHARRASCRGAALLLDLWRSRQASIPKSSEKAEGLWRMDRRLTPRRHFGSLCVNRFTSWTGSALWRAEAKNAAWQRTSR